MMALIHSLPLLPSVSGKQELRQQRGMRASIGRLYSHGYAAGAK